MVVGSAHASSARFAERNEKKTAKELRVLAAQQKYVLLHAIPRLIRVQARGRGQGREALRTPPPDLSSFSFPSPSTHEVTLAHVHARVTHTAVARRKAATPPMGRMPAASSLSLFVRFFRCICLTRPWHHSKPHG
jgi:hypothetical protein